MATTYNFPDHISGDTFDGVSFHIENKLGDMDITGSKIELFINRYLTLQPMLTTENGSILIIDESAVDSTINIPEQIIDWPIGTYDYNIKITFPSGKVKTYIEGHWLITE